MRLGLCRLCVSVLLVMSTAAHSASAHYTRPPKGSIKFVCERVPASMFAGISAIALQNATVIPPRTRLRNILEAALIRRSQLQGTRPRQMPSHINPAYLVSNWLQPLNTSSELCAYKSDAIDSILTCARFVSEAVSEHDVLSATIKGARELLKRPDEEYGVGTHYGMEEPADDSPAGRSWRCSWNLLRQLEVRLIAYNDNYMPGVIYVYNGTVYQYSERTAPSGDYPKWGPLLLAAGVLGNGAAGGAIRG